MSVTIKNLESALAGESMAHVKYRYFAKIAMEEGYEEVAKHFWKTADQELLHAWGHLELLIGKPSPNAHPFLSQWRSAYCVPRGYLWGHIFHRPSVKLMRIGLRRHWVGTLTRWSVIRLARALACQARCIDANFRAQIVHRR